MSQHNSAQFDRLFNTKEEADELMDVAGFSAQRERRLQQSGDAHHTALSSTLAVGLTLSVQAYISTLSRSIDGLPSFFLPTLDLPPPGAINRVSEPQGVYRARPSNYTRDAWMNMFPKGKGYVSLDSIQPAGPVADFVNHQSTDRSGRFCVAAFHQLHCLYLMYEDFYAALDGTSTQPGIHTTHCFDYLRESILCSADTTLEPFKGRFDGGGGGNGGDGFGSVHQRRDFEQLYDWAERFRYNDDTDADRFEG